MAYAKLKTATAVYDFSVHGGTVGVIGLGVYIPKGALITRVIGQVITTLAGAGSTIALDAGATVIKAATAFDNAAYVGIDILNAFATPLELASNGQVTWTIAGAVMTGGKYALYIDYITPSA